MGEIHTVEAIVGKIGEMVFRRIEVEKRYDWLPLDLHGAKVCYAYCHDDLSQTSICVAAVDQPRCRNVWKAEQFRRKYTAYDGIIYVYVLPDYATCTWLAHANVRYLRSWFHPTVQRSVYEVEQTALVSSPTLGPKDNAGQLDETDDVIDYH